MVNNYDWTASLSTIDFLRDIGKHFPVNRMLARDVVRSRLEAGISYTEFSYVLLQSMDFLNLYRDHGVTLQFGGSDQWGNLTGGVELIRRADGGKAHAFATPLVTKADGTKYGKTEGGALWLDPEMMSPYAFYQFWLNVEDEKVGELLRIFTFLPRARRSRSSRPQHRREAVPACRPRRRSPSRSPRWCTARRRPSGSRRRRPRCSAAATSPGLSPPTLAPPWRGRRTVVDGVRARRSSTCWSRPGWPRARARRGRTVTEGGAYLNNERVEDPEHGPTQADLIGGSWLVLRRGKKNFAGVEVG
jgi:tyrosyl-tRNA synthetase